MAKDTTSTPPESAGSRPVARTRAPASGRSSGRPAVAAGSPGGRNAPSLLSFFQEARSELRKVTWPTRQEAMNLTVAVIGMTVAIAAFLGLIDGALDQVIKPLIGAK